MYYNIHSHKVAKCDNTITIYNVSLHNDIIISALSSIGIAPWESDLYTKTNVALLTKYGINENVVAIGEVGLDKRIDTPLTQQLTIFTHQILIAERCNKPMIIHCVGYYNELIQLFRKRRPTVTYILHGFRGKSPLAQELVKHGFYISLGEKSILHQESIQQIPLNKILIETDDSDIHVEEVYKSISSIKNISVEELKKSIEENITQCFGWNLRN